MAISGPFKIQFDDLFPHGAAVVGPVEPLNDFDKSTAQNRVQAKDRDTGTLMWSVECMDLDPEARERTFKIKLTSAVQPVPPEAIAGTPLRPVTFTDLLVTPYVKEGNRPRIGYSLRASGMAAPGRRSEIKAA